MKSFIESICLENGELRNLPLNQRRLELTLLAHFGNSVRIDLSAELSHRSLPATGLYKVRVTYGMHITDIEIEPYSRHQVKKIELVEADTLDYRYKYADRSELDALRGRVAPGVQPVIVQHGLLTDAIYANICVYDGQQWLTPQKPLLEGTALRQALGERLLRTADIRAADVAAGNYPKMKFINCMSLFHEAGDILL